MALNLNKIKGLFIIPEDEIEGGEKKTEPKKEEVKKTETKKTEAKKTVTSTGTPIKTSLNETETTSSSKGEVNKQIFNSLTKAISDANLPGEDYLEFISALQAMKGIDLQESVKMQTVLATLSTKGLTVQKIIESADYYMKVLENEKDKFKQAMAQQTTGKIDSKHKRIKSLEEENLKMTEQIKALTDKINDNNEEIEKVKKDISESDAKIKKTENDFNVTFDYVANQIVDKVEKIKNLNAQ
jgi:chromosome segregation ATPase